MVSGGSTQYAQSVDGDYIAYQVTGDGPIDLLAIFGAAVSIEEQLDGRHPRELIERLNRFARVIRFDRRGTGLSDPLAAIDHNTWENWVADGVSVLDAVGVDRAAVAGLEMTAAPQTFMLAASHPARVSHMALLNPHARWRIADDYPIGLPDEACDNIPARALATWLGGPEFSPSTGAEGDHEFANWYLRARRRTMSPSVAAAVYRNGVSSDFRAVLSTVRVPTLVMRRESDIPGFNERVQYVADHIPGAKLVDLPGIDQLAYVGDVGALVDELEEFLTGTRSTFHGDRVLSTVLFTDVVSSTERLSAVGDRDWRGLLDRYEAAVRREIGRHKGREIFTKGDEFLVTFDGPARAVRCAAAVRDQAAALGLSVRAGVHTGEVELRGDDVAGIAVHIGARVMALAGAGDIFVSRTVTDLVAGSGLRFSDRGEHTLKGVDGTWRLFAVDA